MRKLMIKNFPLIIKILGLSLIIALPNMAQAAKSGYWSWNDDKGNPQYSDRPPEGVNAVFVEKNTTNSPVSGPYQGASNSGNEQSGNSGTMEALPNKDPSICAAAKSNLANLQSARVRITEADGSQHYLTEDEKTEQRERAQRLIELNCD